jgi:uncharacterized RDD family membrane protein YckC
MAVCPRTTLESIPMATSNRTLLGQYAGFITRGAALIMDIVIVSVLVIVINWLISLPFVYFLNLNVQECVNSPESYGFFSALACRLIDFSWILVTVVTAPLYFAILTSLNGQTIGKYAMGVRVVRMDGHRLGFFRSLLRWAGYIVSIIPLGLGFFMSLIDDRRRTLHDRMAGTCVVYAWKARRNEFMLDRVNHWLDGDDATTSSRPGPIDGLQMSQIYDLIAIDVPSFGEVRITMNLLTEGIAKGEYAVVHTAILARDIDGEIGIVGASDLVADGVDLGIMAADVRIPHDYIERLKADMPSDSFIILVLLLDQYAQTVMKAVSRRVAAIIRLYDVGETPDTLTAKEGIEPKQANMGTVELSDDSPALPVATNTTVDS